MLLKIVNCFKIDCQYTVEQMKAEFYLSIKNIWISSSISIHMIIRVIMPKKLFNGFGKEKAYIIQTFGSILKECMIFNFTEKNP